MKGATAPGKAESEMSKLDDKMEQFDKACAAETKAAEALDAAEAALTKLKEDSATLIERIAQADQDLSDAKTTMHEAASGLRDQLDNKAYGRPHCYDEMQKGYVTCRDAVSAAKLAVNGLSGEAETLRRARAACEKAIEEAQLTLKRAISHKLAVAEELRPLIASEVAGYTGRKMPQVVEPEPAEEELKNVRGMEVAP